MRLREVVEGRGYSRVGLARLLSVSRATVDGWCRGGLIPQRHRAAMVGLFGEEDAAAIFRDQGSPRWGPGRPPDAKRERVAVRRVAEIARRRGKDRLARDIEGL